MSNVIFIFNGAQTTIQCLPGDKMGDICKRYSSKLGINIDSLYFLYDGNIINFKSSFKEHINSADKESNKMKILVYQNENDGIICSKCGEKITFDTKLIDNILSSNNDINDILAGVKFQVENIINDLLNQKAINYIKTQLKNINLLINNSILEIKNNSKIISELTNFNKNNCDNTTNNNRNIIEGELDIKLNEIGKGIILFNKENKDGIDVYLNEQKINMKKENDKWIIDYNFKKDGKYRFKIIFNNKVTDLKRFFLECSNISSLDLSNLDTSNVIDMNRMFSKCKILKEIKGLNRLNTRNVTNMNTMFQLCEEIEYLDVSNFDTSNVTDMQYMFNKCYKLKEIKGINKFNTIKVDNMKSMFKFCQNLKYLDLSNFDTSNVIDMDYFFSGCTKIKEIKGLNMLNTKKVNNMDSMFSSCEEIEYLDVSNFDTSNTIDMQYMFNKCSKLKEIKGLNGFNTSNVENMDSMFKLCENLEYLDLSNFDTSNVTNMSALFGGCNKLKSIKGLNGFNTSRVISMKQMFQQCNKLEYLDLSNFDTSDVIDMRFMFFGCNNLQYLNILNFNVNDSTENIFFDVPKNKCKFITNNEFLENLFYSDD